MLVKFFVPGDSLVRSIQVHLRLRRPDEAPMAPADLDVAGDLALGAALSALDDSSPRHFRLASDARRNLEQA
ncbi:MAG: hypothetical protein ACYCS7_14590 [Acidimicrobiales bacterium]